LLPFLALSQQSGKFLVGEFAFPDAFNELAQLLLINSHHRHQIEIVSAVTVVVATVTLKFQHCHVRRVNYHLGTRE